MVEFQPCTLTTLDLGPVAYCYSLVYPFRPTIFFSHFIDRSFPPLSYLLPIRSRSYLKPTKFSTAPHLLSRRKAPPPGILTASAARQPLPLIPAPCVACLHLLPFPCRFDPPFAALNLHPGTCKPPGGSSVADPSVSMYPCLVLPSFSSKYWHRPVLGGRVG